MATTKARTTKARTTKAATAPAPAQQPLYTVGPHAAKVQPHSTLQLANYSTRAGKQWRTANATTRPNTRAAAIAALQQATAAGPQTWATLRAALQPLHKQGTLGSGTPQSYLKAFVANGYIVPANK